MSKLTLIFFLWVNVFSETPVWPLWSYYLILFLFECSVLMWINAFLHLLLAEKYFDMKKNQCKEGLDIYKKFLTRMTRISEFLKVAEVNCLSWLSLNLLFLSLSVDFKEIRHYPNERNILNIMKYIFSHIHMLYWILCYGMNMMWYWIRYIPYI